VSYRLSQDEPVADGLKRVFLEELASAAQSLARTNQPDRDKAVHEARKSVKKLRAILRLVRPHLDAAAFDRDNNVLRSIGRSLSVLRDAVVLIETLDGLREGDLRSIRSAFVQRRKAAGSPDATLARTNSGLRPLKKRVEAWRFTPDGLALIEDGLGDTYKRGRKALADAKAGNDPVVWHTFRKRVKDHWYHVRLTLDLVSGKQWKARKKGLKELEDALGTVHNLVVLRDTILGQPAPRNTREITIALDRIDQAQNRLHAEALRMARRLYDETPGDFIRGLKYAQRVS
jgi:CHAD domain-containing protein